MSECKSGDQICSLDYLNNWNGCIDGCKTMEIGEEYCEKTCVKKMYKDVIKCGSMLPEDVDFPTFAKCMFRAILEIAPCLQMCPPLPQ